MVARHVQEGERHVTRQKEIIEELRRDGHATRIAESLLRVFEQTLLSHKTHAERLRLQS